MADGFASPNFFPENFMSKFRAVETMASGPIYRYEAESREELATIIQNAIADTAGANDASTWRVFEMIEREIFFDIGLTWRN